MATGNPLAPGRHKEAILGAVLAASTVILANSLLLSFWESLLVRLNGTPMHGEALQGCVLPLVSFALFLSYGFLQMGFFAMLGLVFVIRNKNATNKLKLTVFIASLAASAGCMLYYYVLWSPRIKIY